MITCCLCHKLRYVNAIYVQFFFISELNPKNHMLKIQVIREGADITLVGWGAQLAIMEQACVDAEKVNSSNSFYLASRNRDKVY